MIGEDDCECICKSDARDEVDDEPCDENGNSDAASEGKALETEAARQSECQASDLVRSPDCKKG